MEPAKLYFDSTDFHSVMYADKHIEKSELTGSGCGVIGEIQKRMQERLKEANKDMVCNTTFTLGQKSSSTSIRSSSISVLW